MIFTDELYSECIFSDLLLLSIIHRNLARHFISGLFIIKLSIIEIANPYFILRDIKKNQDLTKYAHICTIKCMSHYIQI